MKHQCTACWREFSDDSGDLPESGRVHCVFCGSRIPLRQPTARIRNAIPFSKDVPREEAFALGVISSGGSSYPDTLRQFRVRPRSQQPNDTLIPISQSGESGGALDALEPSRAAWRRGSFWLSLTVGLAVGVAVASSAASLWRRDASTGRAASTLESPPRVVKPVPSAAPASSSPLPPNCAVTPSAPVAAPALASPKIAAPKPFDPLLERRGQLERARSEQRHYHLLEAERSYRRVLAQAPQDSEALAGLGELEVLRGSAAKADAHFKAALAANADYIPALIAVADAKWYDGLGREAQQSYRNIVESYAADLYPPYVAQRAEASVVPDCGER